MRISSINNNISNTTKTLGRKISVPQEISHSIPKSINKKSLISNSLKLSVIGAIFGKAFSEAYSNVLEEKTQKYSDVYENPDKLPFNKAIKLFKDNGFKQNIFGMYSNKDNKEKSYTKLDIAGFKDFVELGKSKGVNLAKTKFSDTLNTYNILCSLPEYNHIRERIKNNPNEFQFIENIINNSADKETLRAFDEYKKYNFSSINKFFRNSEEKDSKIEKDIEKMETYINTQKITTPITLYRGEGLGVLENIKLEDENGKDFNLAEIMRVVLEDNHVDNGINGLKEFLKTHKAVTIHDSFVSTTLDKKQVDFFIKDMPEKIIWTLQTTPNTKGVYMEGLDINNANSGENEVLLQHNSKILMKDIDYDKAQNIWNITGEVSN